MTTKQKLIKINQPTEQEFKSLEFIQEHRGITTISRATVEAINSYPYFVNRIKELEKQLEEEREKNLDMMIKIDDYLTGFEALKGILKRKNNK